MLRVLVLLLVCLRYWDFYDVPYLHRMSTSSITLIYLAITLFAISPFLLAVLADVVGDWLGCNINEGGTDPCLRWGFDFGKFLYPMFVMGWLTLMTIPVAVLLGIGFTIYILM